MATAVGRPFLLLFHLPILLLALPLLRSPHKISLNMNGAHSSTVLADRATISLKISSVGPKQSKVADQVRQASDAILQLLRPLTLPPNRTSPTPPTSQSEVLSPPITTLSVNTFSSTSYPRPGLLGDTVTYTASITITAEFQSSHPRQDVNAPGQPRSSNSNRTVTPNSAFHYLSLVLPVLAKQPHTKVEYLKWFLSPDYLASLQSIARQAAMGEALLKIADFITPMDLRFPIARCLRFREQRAGAAYERYQSNVAGIMKQGEAMHDELDGPVDGDAQGLGRYGYEIEGRKEAFGLEPQSMEIASAVDGEWIVQERGLVAVLWEWMI